LSVGVRVSGPAGLILSVAVCGGLSGFVRVCMCFQWGMRMSMGRMGACSNTGLGVSVNMGMPRSIFAICAGRQTGLSI